jgi:flagellar biosynthesis chaperone FliJ
MTNPGSVLKELLEYSVEEDLNYMRFISLENKTIQRIREEHQKELETVELCREILFDNAKLMNFLKERIENDRRRIKEIG